MKNTTKTTSTSAMKIFEDEKSYLQIFQRWKCRLKLNNDRIKKKKEH